MFIAKYFQRGQKLEKTQGISFLKVEFLTQQQKIDKDIAMEKVSKMYQDIDEDIIVNKDNQYKASFRKTFQFENKYQIRVSQLLEIFEAGVQHTDVYQFMNTQVQSIQLIMFNHKAIQPDAFLKLLDMEQQLQNDESKVLELIYKRTSLLKRIKIGAKKAVLSIPKLFMNLILKLIKFILSMMGLDSVFGIGVKMAKSIVSPKAIITSILGVISMFFPILGPFLALSKMV